MELLVGVFVMGLIALGATEVLVKGAQYLRVNQSALDAQRSCLNLLSQIVAGMQTTQATLVVSDANGLCFASPFKPDGSAEFDNTYHRLLWQKWVCFYYDPVAQTVTLKEQPIVPATNAPGAPPVPSTLSGAPSIKNIASDISQFTVTQKSASPPLWSLDITAGSMTDVSRYGLQLHSEVSPRN